MKRIVFFDGDCGLCSSSVRFFAKYDRHDHLRFAPLQGETAAAKEFGKYAAIDDGTMVVCREADGKVFFRFDALLESLRALGGLWKVLLVAKLLPCSIRELLYRTVARNRMHWFGKADTCALPDPALVRRLLP